MYFLHSFMLPGPDNHATQWCGSDGRTDCGHLNSEAEETTSAMGGSVVPREKATADFCFSLSLASYYPAMKQL